MSLVAHLRNIGLEDKEARVYLAMLELGPSTVLEIAAKAEVTRPTAYVVIESLKRKGLVSTQTRGKKQIFIAESPDQIKVNLEKEEKLIEQRKEEFSQLLPQLDSLFKTSDSRPEVRYFEGKEGLLTIQELFLKNKTEIWGISDMDTLLKLFPELPSGYTPKRVSKKIPSRLIYTSEKGDFLKSKDQESLRQSKFIPKDKFNFSADISIFGDNVVIASLEGRISGVVMQHKNIADSFRGIYNILWNSN